MKSLEAAQAMKLFRLPSSRTERKFEVYRNLQKRCWSVRSFITKKVVCHEESLYLYAPIFRVQQAGNRKVRETGVKNVHAYVQGYWNGPGSVPNSSLFLPSRIKYNPFDYRTFVFANTDDPVFSLPNEYVYFDERGQLWVQA